MRSFCARLAVLVTVLASCAGLATAGEEASTRLTTLSTGSAFTERSGEALYANVCQGCHMADGRGAAGAATYPALAGNAKLASSDYVVGLVMNGGRGMPGLGWAMDDAQVAAVATYVRSHFGNSTGDPVALEDIRRARR